MGMFFYEYENHKLKSKIKYLEKENNELTIKYNHLLDQYHENQRYILKLCNDLQEEKSKKCIPAGIIDAIKLAMKSFTSR
jgi:ribosomal protein S1